MAESGWTLRYAPSLGFPTLSDPFFLHSVGSADPVAQIAHVAALGFSGVQDNFLQDRSEAEQERIGAALATHELEMGCVWLRSEGHRRPLWQSAEPEARVIVRDELRAAAAAQKRAGGKYLTLTVAAAPGVAWGFQLGALIETLKALADEAARLDMVIVLEATADARFPGGLMNRLEWAWLVAHQVNHPSVRLVFDILHVQTGEGAVLEKAAQVWDFVELVQIADCPGRVEPGAGEINFPAFFRFLRARNYGGLVELEHRKSLPGRAGEDLALARLRAIEAAF